MRKLEEGLKRRRRLLEVGLRRIPGWRSPQIQTSLSPMREFRGHQSRTERKTGQGSTLTGMRTLSQGGAMRRRNQLEGRLHDCLPGRDTGGNHSPGLRRNNGGRIG